jgi:hypothetical protein
MRVEVGGIIEKTGGVRGNNRELILLYEGGGGRNNRENLVS